MKILQNIIVLFGMSLATVSCDLVGSIDDIHPNYKLEDDNVITDAASAENMLRGVYTCWRNSSITSMRINMSLYCGSLNSLASQIYMIEGGQDFLQNNVLDNNLVLEPLYKDLYKLINMANLTIEKLEAGQAPDLTPVRLEEMIAECRFHRAMAHFFLLRHFGQFYDENSSYGVELRDTPYQGIEIAPRATVAKTYQFILEDLAAAAKKAPEKVEAGKHWYISRTTAKALQARVLLCQKKYKEAGLLATEVIREAAQYGYELSTDYAGIFKQGHSSNELLFGIYSFGVEESCTGNFNYTIHGAYSEQIAVRDADHNDLTTGDGFDKRFAAAFAGESTIVDDDDSDMVPDVPGMDPVAPQEIRVNHKYPFRTAVSGEQGNTYFVMRLAEVYYIHAEAAARQNDWDGARQSLADVMERAGYTRSDIDQVSNNDLLEYIRQSKWIELFSENNEEWFDMVRYYKEGNLSLGQLRKIKASLSQEEQLILPLPKTALAGNHLLVQNP